MVEMLEGGRNIQVRPGEGSLAHRGYALEVMIGSQSPLLPCCLALRWMICSARHFCMLGVLITGLRARYHRMKPSKLWTKVSCLCADCSDICWVVERWLVCRQASLADFRTYWKIPRDVLWLSNFAMEKTSVLLLLYPGLFAVACLLGFVLNSFYWI